MNQRILHTIAILAIGTFTINKAQACDLPPVANITEIEVNAAVGETITLHGNTSYDPDGTIIAYAWSCLNGTMAMVSGGTDPNMQCQFLSPGIYTVQLQVMDNSYQTDADTCVIYVQAKHETAILDASDGAMGDFFGSSVSICGDYAIAGARGDGENGSLSGSAYMFVRTVNGWSQQAKLIPLDGASSDYFGYSVSMDGDYAIVGAYGNDDAGSRSGSAYIFFRDGTSWNQQAKINALDAAAGDEFGRAVAIQGDYAIIGATGDSENGSYSGSAYIFIRSGTSWTQQAKLFPADGASGDWFGASVSIDGTYVIIGANGDDNANGGDAGSAYVFIRDGTSWNPQAKLLATDGGDGDKLGWSVSISGDSALIGAFADDDEGTDSGSAYVFVRDGTSWSEQWKLTASDGAEYDYFGVSVSIDGDIAVVGAYNEDACGENSGSAYLFVRDSGDWDPLSKLIASDGAAGDLLGKSVSVEGDTAIAGAEANAINRY